MANIVSKNGMTEILNKKAKKSCKAVGGIIKAEYSGEGKFKSVLLNEILKSLAPNVLAKTLELLKTDGGWTIEIDEEGNYILS